MAAGYLDAFFELGNKATRGDPLQKAKFDYQLYWIVFISFLFICINYYFKFFFGDAQFSVLAWALVISVFCWFNYWGLVGFRSNYINMKEATESIKDKEYNISEDEEKEELDMVEEFDNLPLES